MQAGPPLDGVRRPARAARTALLAAAGVVAVVLVVALVFVISGGSQQRVTVQTRSYTLAPTQATLVFEVTRAPGTALRCDVRARDVDSVEVGATRGISVAASTQQTSVVTASVALTAPATVVEVESCTRTRG